MVVLDLEDGVLIIDCRECDMQYDYYMDQHDFKKSDIPVIVSNILNDEDFDLCDWCKAKNDINHPLNELMNTPSSRQAYDWSANWPPEGF